MSGTPTTSEISIVAAGSQLSLTFSLALSPRNCRRPTIVFSLTLAHSVQTMKCSDSRRCLNSISRFQRKRSRRRSAMFANWSRGCQGFPANSKSVLIQSRLRSCWVKSCASIFQLRHTGYGQRPASNQHSHDDSPEGIFDRTAQVVQFSGSCCSDRVSQ